MKTFIFLIATTALYSQTPHPLEFFPHHQDDIFEYYFKNQFCQPCPPDSFQNVITKDSLGDDGKYFLQSSYFGKWTVDTVTYEVYNGPFLTLLKFKLDADSGDTWIVYRFENGGAMKAEVVDIFNSSYLGQDVVVKVINYTDSASGLFVSAYWLSSKFGIIAEYGDPPGQPNYYLRGARINGITYGTVTSVEPQGKNLPGDFVLYQNYPNPFNPNTKISWQLNEDGFVSLKVYDMIGKEVKTLINEYKESGYYEINFDGSSFSSGVYFYRLIVNGNTHTRKMSLIR